jgi:hypothetical protein
MVSGPPEALDADGARRRGSVTPLKRTEAIYLATRGPADLRSLQRAADLVRALGQRGTLRHTVEAPWVQLERSTLTATDAGLEPQSPAWFSALLVADARRWTGLSNLARALSEKWDEPVITLEGAKEVFWVRYSRWSAGARKRCFEYAASDVLGAGWVQNEGPPEPWEEDEEVGPDVASLGVVLRLPGLASSADPHLAWCATEVVP